MFLDQIEERNPTLLSTAIELHQKGKIPANCYLMDLDAISSNAKVIADEAKSLGLTTYLMSKQLSRNPIVVKAVLEAGFNSTVAVSVMGAKILHRHQMPVGHVGHLSQIPKHEIKDVLMMKPEMWTVYSYDMATWISDEACNLNMVQAILIKVADEGNQFLPGQDSGIWMYDLDNFVKEVKKLSGVKVVGVTAFPCATYDVYGDKGTKITPNFEALQRAKDILETNDVDVTVINTPGNTSFDNLEMFSKHGATHVEPGHGVTGTTPAHLYNNLPEIPALVYVSEISHHFKEYAYAYGGGLYVCIAGGPPGYQPHAIIGNSEEPFIKTKVEWDRVHRDNIDYYAMLKPGNQCQVGDTVVFGFRPQAFVTRAYTAAVSGIATGNPIVHGVFDCMGHLVE